MAYATRSDLETFGVSAESWDETKEDAEAYLDAASDLADSYLRLHYQIPFPPPVPTMLKQAVCKIAAYEILSHRGYNPEGDAGQLLTRYKQAIDWLKDVGSGRAVIGIDEPGEGHGGPFVVSPSRGEPSLVLTVPPQGRGW